MITAYDLKLKSSVNLAPHANHNTWDESAVWSPHGEHIAFASNRDGAWEIYVADARGSEPYRLTNNYDNESNLNWSPDGKWLSYETLQFTEAKIYLLNVETGKNQFVARGFGESWSPDGKQLVYREGPYFNKGDLVTVRVDSLKKVAISKGEGNNFDPRWSPDGQKIAFTSNRHDGWKIFTMNPDGSDVTQLTHDTGVDWTPTWSPDSKRIAFMSTRAGSFNIFTIDANGKNMRQLTTSGGNWNPVWSPDGNSIAYENWRNESGIYVIAATGGIPERLSNGQAYGPISWRPK